MEMKKNRENNFLYRAPSFQSGMPHSKLVVALFAFLWDRAKRLRPRTNRVYLLVREPRLRVQHPVRERRHPFFPDFFANQGEVLVGLLGIFLRLPILKVDMT